MLYLGRAVRDGDCTSFRCGGASSGGARRAEAELLTWPKECSLPDLLTARTATRTTNHLDRIAFDLTQTKEIFGENNSALWGASRGRRHARESVPIRFQGRVSAVAACAKSETALCWRVR